MKSYSALLVDDEQSGLRTLTAKIEWSQLPLTIIAQVDSVDRAQKVLENEPVDFIFLDVKMPVRDGFDLFDSIDTNISDVIFTTAHEEYALKAFKEKASGYLLKPISQREFNSLMSSLIAKRNIKTERSQKIIFKLNRELIQLDQEEIIYLLSEGVKSRLFTVSNGENVISSHLKVIESNLPIDSFYRIHHQSIVNLRHVTKVYKAKHAKVLMTNGQELEISRSKKMEFYLKYTEYLNAI